MLAANSLLEAMQKEIQIVMKSGKKTLINVKDRSSILQVESAVQCLSL